MKKRCEHCVHNACSYKTRGLENKCEKVQDYEQGYEDAVEKACDVLKVILEDFLHGGDSDIVIALLQEKMEEEE